MMKLSTKTYSIAGILALMLSSSTMIHAAPTLVTGTPSDSYTSPVTPLSPILAGGTLINFDSLTPNSTFSPTTYASLGVSSISSPDGLLVYPYSGQSAPNYLFDTSSGGSANITISLASGADAIGIGIADSDASASGVPVTLTLQALSQNGTPFGPVFNVTNPTTGTYYGNGYYLLEDTSNDIFGLQITQPVSNPDLNSGLAIDDLQFQSTPEPSTWTLALIALGATFLLRRCSRRA